MRKKLILLGVLIVVVLAAWYMFDLGQYLNFYYIQSRQAEWQQQLQVIDMFSKLSPELRGFLSKPVNEPYLRIAKQLSELQVEKLRTVAEGLLEITL